MEEEQETNTVSNLPVGFRFCPTDEELIVHYLRNKVHSSSLPCGVIREANLYDQAPDEIIRMFNTMGEKEWYFFTPRERKYPNGMRPNRKAGDGYWKATGADKSIKDVNGKKVGRKKALVYYFGKPPHGQKTSWIMHEYRLEQQSIAPTPSRSQAESSSTGLGVNMRLDNWVLCKIYMNVRNSASTLPARVIVEEPASSTEDEGQGNEMSGVEEAALVVPPPMEPEMQEHGIGSYTADIYNSYLTLPDFTQDFAYVNPLSCCMPPFQNQSQFQNQVPQVPHDLPQFYTSNSDQVPQVNNSGHEDAFHFYNREMWGTDEFGSSQLGFFSDLPPCGPAICRSPNCDESGK